MAEHQMRLLPVAGPALAEKDENRKEANTMMDASRHTYEDFRNSLERFRFSDAIKNTILHRAEQEGELTYDQMMALYAYAYPEE